MNEIDQWEQQEIGKPNADIVLIGFFRFAPHRFTPGWTTEQMRAALNNDIDFQKFRVIWNLDQVQLDVLKREVENERAQRKERND